MYTNSFLSQHHSKMYVSEKLDSTYTDSKESTHVMTTVDSISAAHTKGIYTFDKL